MLGWVCHKRPLSGHSVHAILQRRSVRGGVFDPHVDHPLRSKRVGVFVAEHLNAVSQYLLLERDASPVRPADQYDVARLARRRKRQRRSDTGDIDLGSRQRRPGPQ